MFMNIPIFCLSTFMSMHDICQHTRASSHAEITRTSLSCGSDECDTDSLSLLIHAYIQNIHTCVYLYTYTFFSFVFLSIHHTCSNKLSFSRRYRYLFLYDMELSALPPDIFAGLSSLRWVCAFLVAFYRVLYFTSIRTHGRTCTDR